MKKLFSAFAITLISLSSFAQDSSVKKYYDLLTPENKAKANLGKIAKVVVVEAEAKASNKTFPKKAGGAIGTKTQALVDARTCYAAVYVQDVNYSTSTDCNGNETLYMNNANIAVEIDYRTFPYDFTDINVILYAQNRFGSSSALILTDDLFTVESDGFGSGANTVVYVVDAQYARDYNIFADVLLNDEFGTACLIETNSTTIQ